MGNPEWAKDPIFQNRIETTDEHGDQADGYLSEWLMKHEKEEIFKVCQDNRVPAAPIKTVAEVIHDQHLEARKYFIEKDHPRAGKIKYPGVCYKFSETPTVFERHAPSLGEHNEEIFCARLGFSKEDLVRFKQSEVI